MLRECRDALGEARHCLRQTKERLRKGVKATKQSSKDELDWIASLALAMTARCLKFESEKVLHRDPPGTSISHAVAWVEPISGLK